MLHQHDPITAKLDSNSSYPPLTIVIYKNHKHGNKNIHKNKATCRKTIVGFPLSRTFGGQISKSIQGNSDSWGRGG